MEYKTKCSRTLRGLLTTVLWCSHGDVCSPQCGGLLIETFVHHSVKVFSRRRLLINDCYGVLTARFVHHNVVISSQRRLLSHFRILSLNFQRACSVLAADLKPNCDVKIKVSSEMYLVILFCRKLLLPNLIDKGRINV